MIVEEQISARQQKRPGSDSGHSCRAGRTGLWRLVVKSASGRKYRWQCAVPACFENFCSCADFAVNTLGTCKHIEALLLRLRRRFGRSFDSHRYQRTRASLSLHYGDTVKRATSAFHLTIRGSPEDCLRVLRFQCVSSKGHLRRFEKLSRSCGPWTRRPLFTAIVLDFVDRENELTSGLEDERRYLAQLKKRQTPLEGLLKVPLFPYQIRGALFAACRGRVILADDMGLGKQSRPLLVLNFCGAVEALRGFSWLLPPR